MNVNMDIMRRWICLCLCVIVSIVATAQLSRCSGARAMGVGDCVAVMDGPGSFSDNPAAMASLSENWFFLTAGNHFLCPELNTLFTAFLLPSKSANIGAYFNYYGANQYHVSSTGLSLTKVFYKKIFVGLRLKYFNVHQNPDNSNLHMGSFDFGATVNLSPVLSWGGYIYNPLSLKSKNCNISALPYGVCSGIRVKTGVYTTWLLEAEKESGRKLNLKSGIECVFGQIFTLRSGIQTATRSLAFGCGIKLSNSYIDLSCTSNQYAGESFQLSFYHSGK